MQTFHLALALGPLAIYLLVLGGVNLARRPLVVNGRREIAALGLALAGFVAVGPMQLFMPEAAVKMHGLIWLPLMFFYVLSLILWTMLSRPRLVVYNVSRDEILPRLKELALRLDPDATWNANVLTLPALGVQLEVEDYATMRNVTLAATAVQQSFTGWRRLEGVLRGALQAMTVQRNPRGVSLLTAGLLLLGVVLWRSVQNPQALAQGLIDMFWL